MSLATAEPDCCDQRPVISTADRTAVSSANTPIPAAASGFNAWPTEAPEMTSRATICPLSNKAMVEWMAISATVK